MIKTGDMLLMVSTRGSEPFVRMVRVERTEPLILLIPGNGEDYEPVVGETVNFIHRDAEGDAHASGKIRSVTKYGLSFVVDVESASWLHFDKRRAERFQVEIRGEVTQVDEQGGEIQIANVGSTLTDLSSLGCHLRCDHKLEVGSLVAVSASDPDSDEPWRFLGIVTRKTATGYGIEFFDYFESTRYRLESYLGSLKKAA